MRRLAVLAVLALAPLTAPAEEPAKPKTYAVVVGVAAPGDPAVEARPSAEADAAALYDRVVDPKHIGADGANARLLLGAEDMGRHGEPATREQIVKALSWVAAKAGKDDLVIVAFFGRGASAGDRTCFFSSGSTVKNRLKDALLATDIEHAIKGLKSERVLALLDVDYKGVKLAGEKAALEPSVNDLVTAFVGDEDAEEKTLPPGRVVLNASGSVGRHIEWDGRGLFGRALTEALAGEADADGYEADGVVTVDEIHKYLEAKVVERARKLGKANEEKEQSPYIWGTRAYHFAVSRNPAVAAKNAERAAKIAAMPLDKAVIREGTQLIGRMPKLKGQQELRKVYVALADGKVGRDEFAKSRADILKGMELEKEEAESFARRTLTGLETVKRVYIKELRIGEMVAWALKGTYRALEVKAPPEVADKLKDAAALKRAELHDLLADARTRLGRREDLERNKDVDLAIRSALFNLDPHTMYFGEDQIQQIQSKLLGHFTGIGVNVRRDMVRDGLLVISPILGSPAHKRGVKAGDLITEIIREVDAEGKPISPPEVTSTKGMKSEDAVRKIMGQPRTKVKIKVERDGALEPIVFELERRVIDVETVMGVKRNADDSWDHWLDPKRKIGYIRLTEFAPRSFEDMERVVRRLQRDGVKGVILDLRFNPGGSLTAAVEISNLFIDDGLIVTVKPRSGVDDETAYTGKRKTAATNFTGPPMAVLVNGGSASASEIVSACMQDHERAVVMGERSYGKGSVQTIIDFPPTRAKIKLTTATFWRPSGKNLHKANTGGKETDEWGVTPDEGFVIPLSRDERLALEEQLREMDNIPNRTAKKEAKPPVPDRQLDAALKHLREQIPEPKDATSKNGD